MAHLHTNNYYQATRRVELTVPALEQDLNVDVAIIGGGITGVSAALHLAERGYQVALLEAQDIGWGASGRNGGQILAGFGASQVKMKKLLGPEPAQRLWDMSIEAVNLLHDLIRRFDIPCDPVQGYLHAALKAAPGARPGGDPGGIRAARRPGRADSARRGITRAVGQPALSGRLRGLARRAYPSAQLHARPRRRGAARRREIICPYQGDAGDAGAAASKSRRAGSRCAPPSC